MARRGKGEGSIYQRKDGRWTASITIESGGGKRQRRAFYGQTRAEVAKKLREAQRFIDEGLKLPRESLTVSAFLSQWLEAKRGDLRPSTWKRYNDYCRLHITPEIGRKRLARLSVQEVQSFQAALPSHGLSGTSAAHVHGVLHAAFADAERWSLVPRNVISLVRAPKRSTGEMRFLSPEDARALLTAVKGKPMEALYVLALTSGLRLGELSALRWKDIDLERSRLRVVATLVNVQDGKPVFGEPKTAHSRRTVWLTSAACEALKIHKGNQEDERKLAAEAWTEFGLVFTNAVGKPMDGSHVLSRSLYPLLDKVGIPRLRFHDLRHSAASMLLSEGVPIKVVSEMLGHADVAITLRVYAHVIDGAQEQAVTVMERLLHS